MAGVGVGGGSGARERGVRVPSGCSRPRLRGPTPGWLRPLRLLRDGDFGRGRVRAPDAGGGAAAVAARPPGADGFARGKDTGDRRRGTGSPAPSPPAGPVRGSQGTARPRVASCSRAQSFWGGVTGPAPSRRWPRPVLGILERSEVSR